MGFDNEVSLHRHLRQRGTRGSWAYLKKLDEKADTTASTAAVDRKVAPSENESGFDLDECVICLERPVNAAFFECGHQAFCSVCAEAVFKRQGSCPLCRLKVVRCVSVKL